MNLANNYRFDERSFFFTKILNESKNLTIAQINQILDNMDCQWSDLTFKFYESGSVTIIDNNSEEKIDPRDLKNAALDFYIRKRIELIKDDLKIKQLQYA